MSQPNTPEAKREPHRKVLRLQGHDYAEGAYYVAQVAQHRQRLFGKVLNGRMWLSPAGRMIQETWLEIPRCCAAYTVDAFVVMPDPVHGIVRVHRNAHAVGAPLCAHAAGASLCGRPRMRYHDDRQIPLNPAGMLALQLADVSQEKPVTILSGGRAP